MHTKTHKYTYNHTNKQTRTQTHTDTHTHKHTKKKRGQARANKCPCSRPPCSGENIAPVRSSAPYAGDYTPISQDMHNYWQAALVHELLHIAFRGRWQGQQPFTMCLCVWLSGPTWAPQQSYLYIHTSLYDIYVNEQTCKCVCVCMKWMHVRKDACIHACTYVRVYTRVWICTMIYICIHM
jgi:hypothetical protein